MATNICYLCGTPIAVDDTSKDHVIPKQFTKRKQPKAKGYDYAGSLPSHKSCNNQFGPEVYTQKALMLLEVLYEENCFSVHQHRDHPEITILALNADRFSEFTRRERQFFKITDVRELPYKDWSDPEFFSDKKKSDPHKDSLFVALSVLAKSAAALLIARRLKSIPSCWHIITIPFIGARDVDFDVILGKKKPFEDNVKIWIHPLGNNDWFVIYKVENVLFWFLFWFSGNGAALEQILQNFGDAERLCFEGKQLTQLIGYEWKKI